MPDMRADIVFRGSGPNWGQFRIVGDDCHFIASHSGKPSSRQASAKGPNTAGSNPAVSESPQIVKVGSHSRTPRAAAVASAARPHRKSAAARIAREMLKLRL